VRDVHASAVSRRPVVISSARSVRCCGDARRALAEWRPCRGIALLLSPPSYTEYRSAPRLIGRHGSDRRHSHRRALAVAPSWLPCPRDIDDQVVRSPNCYTSLRYF